MASSVLRVQGKLHEALKAYRDCLATRDRLVAADRSNTQWQRDLAVSRAKLATVFDVQGRIADALAGIDPMAALVAIVPGNAQWEKDLAWFEEQIACLGVLEGKRTIWKTAGCFITPALPRAWAASQAARRPRGGATPPIPARGNSGRRS
jgi:hypothetical protein